MGVKKGVKVGVKKGVKKGVKEDDSIVGDVQFGFCQTSEMLEHISHLDIEVVELAVVLFVLI